MSKFDELCLSYKTSRENFFSYRDDIQTFAAELIGKYIRYLRIPEKQLKFVPLKKELKANTLYTLFGSIHFNNEDNYWYLGVEITLAFASNDIPEQPVLIRFMFKRTDDDIFLVKLYEQDPGHSININNINDFLVFFDFLQNQIRALFEKTPHEFLESSAPLRTVGLPK